MVISGVHLDPQNGKPLRYKVENSWGENSGDKGFFVMTDRWFEQYVHSIHVSHFIRTANSGSVCRFVYQVVVPKSLAPKELVAVLESGDRVTLPPWDPMVSRQLRSCVISLSGL